MFVGGYTVFTLSVRSSVMFCFLNIFKSHKWNFIKPCILFHIYRLDTDNGNVWASGHFFESYFPLKFLIACVYAKKQFLK